MDTFLNTKDLNPEQLKAVEAFNGPVLVLAGAGSGKTRVITYRIALLLLENYAKPWQILAVTFTNKAASEMRQRVNSMLGMKNSADLFIGTFHAFGAKLLRRHAAEFDRTGNFTIYDDDDKTRLLRTILKPKVSSAEVKSYLAAVKGFINRVKGSLGDPEIIANTGLSSNSDLLIEIYHQYNKALQQNNAFDFDDLINLPCLLFRENARIKSKYRDRFQYLLIDEFQDTNLPQGEIVRLLGAPTGNVMAVGDDDQSIYGWRGAHLGNILQFDKDFKGVKTFKLEQNYRSTQAILNVAHRVIKNNASRHPKKLWTKRKGGGKPVVIPTNDDREEASTVIETIQELHSNENHNLEDFVILYRTNAQSRTFEDILRQNTIPYIIVGGLRFYERKEVKDFLAYLRLLTNPSDIISIQRVINLPPRGIGQKTFERLIEHSDKTGKSLFKSILHADQIESLGKTAAKKVQQFGQWIDKMQQSASAENLFKVGERLLHESGLVDYYKKEDETQTLTRTDNLSELLNALKEYSYASDRTAIEDLEDFLQEVALVTDIDRWNSDEQAVTLMTLHSAKGLEFPVVFLTGLEEGLFPLANTLDKPRELEEERRLFYVGATRAMDRLFLTYARNRRRWGQEIPWQNPSRFLNEIPDEMLDIREEPLAIASNQQTESLFSQSGYKFRRETAQINITEKYPMGARVQHSSFGEGMVIEREGRGESLRLLVNFDSVGQKLLLASYAKLKVI